MKYWVQFLQHSALDTSVLVDACGDRGVFVLDGRNSQETMRRDALEQAQRLQHWQRWPAFQIVQGPRLFTESKRSPIERITYPVHI